MFQTFPNEFLTYIRYCRNLKFDEAPDYMYLRKLFRIPFRALNFQYDYVYDWTVLKEKEAADKLAATAPVTAKTKGKI